MNAGNLGKMSLPETNSVLTVTLTTRLKSDSSRNTSVWFKHPRSDTLSDTWWRISTVKEPERSGSMIEVFFEVGTKSDACGTTKESRPLGPQAVILTAISAELSEVNDVGMSLSVRRLYYSGSLLVANTLTRTSLGKVSQSSAATSASRPTATEDADDCYITVWISFLIEPFLLGFLRDQLTAAPERDAAARITPVEVIPIAYRNLWATKDFADLVIKLDGGEELLLHKLLLQASSPVFRAMFEIQHDLGEKTNVVRIEGVSNEVMQQAVKFVYLHQADTAEVEVTKSLVDVAEKYQLKLLKEHCEDALIVHLSRNPELGSDLLPLADRYSLGKLKQYCEAHVMARASKCALTTLQLAIRCKSDVIPKFLILRLASLLTCHPGTKTWSRIQSVCAGLAAGTGLGFLTDITKAKLTALATPAAGVWGAKRSARSATTKRCYIQPPSPSQS